MKFAFEFQVTTFQEEHYDAKDYLILAKYIR